MELIYHGPGSTPTASGDVAAGSGSLWRYAVEQSRYVIQNFTGAEMQLAFEVDTATWGDQKNIIVADGATFIIERQAFTKVYIRAAATATFSGASKNASFVAWTG